MHQELVLYISVAGLIGIMLILCMDVVKKSYKITHSNQNETRNEVRVEESQTTDENPLVYPLYVDCSQEILVS